MDFEQMLKKAKEQGKTNDEIADDFMWGFNDDSKPDEEKAKRWLQSKYPALFPRKE